MADIKRLSIDKDYFQIFRLSQFAFQYKLSDEAVIKKREEARRHIIWGWMKDDRLAAKLHLIPLSCYINGKPFKMGGVSSVATWPEFRRQGAVKELLFHALHYMKQEGYTLSFLHPFSFAFYRKYGWEHTFSKKEYVIPIDYLKRNGDVSGDVQRIEDDRDLLQTIYDKAAKRFNGMLIRDHKWWEQRVLGEDWNKIVAYGGDGQAEGYVLYEVKDNTVTIHEWIYHSLNAQKLLLQFIANHDSMAETVKMTVPENDQLPLLIDEPRFQQKIKPYFMARIVDVSEFLKQYPFYEGGGESVTLHIDDAFLPENSGVYQLSHIDGKTRVTQVRANTAKQEGIHCSVSHLTAMLTGFKRPSTLYQAGLIHGEHVYIEQFEKMIPERQTFLSDFF